MNRFALVSLLAFSVSGCATLGGPVTSPVPTNDVSAIIARVQAATRSICGFVPIVSTIGGLLGGDVVDAFAIAQAICNAVSPVPPPVGVMSFVSAAGPVVVSQTKSGVVTANVNGVQVSGRFAKSVRAKGVVR